MNEYRLHFKSGLFPHGLTYLWLQTAATEALVINGANRKNDQKPGREQWEVYFYDQCFYVFLDQSSTR